MHKENHSFFFLSAVSGTTGILTKEEYRHACRALRINPNAAFYGTDGNGNIYKCKLTGESMEHGEVDIIETFPQPTLSPAVGIYIGLPDREPFEEALTGLSALGASAIIPMVCRYCQEPWWRPWEKHLDRLRRKMIAAVKQAHNPRLPDLYEPQPLAETLFTLGSRVKSPSVRIVADPDGVTAVSVVGGATTIDRIDCFIGPPGGFSPDELDRLSSEGFSKVNLSRYRLRTELAAIVLCAEIMQHFLETNPRGGAAILPDVK
jgi:16S rRNA (uracil1498-N3)-methyltransferase